MKQQLLRIPITLIGIILLWSAGTNLFAQNASIQGIVTDHSNGQALFGANITLQSPETADPARS